MAVDIDWLEKNLIKRDLSDDERTALECIEEVTVAAGEKILAEGEEGGTLSIMRAGKAKVEDNNRYEGRVTLVEIEEGTVFGELAFLNNRRRTADVTALEDCRVYKLSQDNFAELMRNQQPLAYEILTAIMERQGNLIMSQRVTLAPYLRQLREKAQGIPLFIKVVPLVFIALYTLGFFYISWKDFDYSK